MRDVVLEARPVRTAMRKAVRKLLHCDSDVIAMQKCLDRADQAIYKLKNWQPPEHWHQR